MERIQQSSQGKARRILFRIQYFRTELDGNGEGRRDIPISATHEPESSIDWDSIPTHANGVKYAVLYPKQTDEETKQKP